MKNGRGYPLPQGSTVTGNTVNFSVAVPQGQSCELLLYPYGAARPAEILEMKEDPTAGNLRHICVELERPEEYEYSYRIGGEERQDPYSHEFGSDGKIRGRQVRSRIVGDTFPWEGDVPLNLPAHEIVAYSLHVRGFTKNSASGVKDRGTFAGLREKIPYLRELGVNQIQCMPVYAFRENPHYKNYWGYGDGYFFAPQTAYAAGDAVRELKELVKELHLQGMELVLEMPFTAETPLGQMMDCLRFWVMEYHIDGFLVNPMLLDIGRLRMDPVLARTKLLRKEDGFQNVMRRFLKGDEGMVPHVMWQLRHIDRGGGTFNYITSQNGFTLQDLVSYDGKHNEANGEHNEDGPDCNYSWNCGAEGPTRKKAVLRLRERQKRNAFLLLLLAQGMPCLLAGDEFGNTQKGNNNVYCQDNTTAWLDFDRLPRERELHDFVRDLIAFRREHRLLHPAEEMLGSDPGGCGVPDVSYHGEDAWRAPTEMSSRQLGVYYHDVSGQEPDLYVAYNMHWTHHDFALPALPKGKKWYGCISTDEGVLKEPRPVTTARGIRLPERTICVFLAK